MKKIALIGVENSHAPAFLRLIREKPEKYGDLEVVGVYSYDGGAAQKLVDEGLAPMAADRPTAFLDRVEGVINTARHGDFHYEYSLPYLRAGIPMFIDKPFCIAPHNARELIETANASGAAVCGGSSLKFARELLDVKSRLQGGEFGGLLSASLSAPVNMTNPYGNFFFYAAHLAQMLLTLLGRPDSVRAFGRENAVTAVCRYGAYDVTLQYVGYYYSVTVFGSKSSFHTPVTVDETLYEAELDEFCAMLRTGSQPVPASELTDPVALLDAIYLSYRTGTEQPVCPIL